MCFMNDNNFRYTCMAMHLYESWLGIPILEKYLQTQIGAINLNIHIDIIIFSSYIAIKFVIYY